MLGECVLRDHSHLSLSCTRTSDGVKSLFLWWLTAEPFLAPHHFDQHSVL